MYRMSENTGQGDVAVGRERLELDQIEEYREDEVRVWVWICATNYVPTA
jgi:hypothetical protein